MDREGLRGAAFLAECLAQARACIDGFAAVLAVDLLELRRDLALDLLRLRESSLEADLHGAVAANHPCERMLLAENLDEERLYLGHGLLGLGVFPAARGDQ